MKIIQNVSALLLSLSLLGASAALANPSEEAQSVVFAGIPLGASQSTVSETLLKRAPRPVLISQTPTSLHFANGFFFAKPAHHWLFLFDKGRLYAATVELPVADAAKNELISQLKALVLQRYGLPQDMKWEKLNTLYGEEHFIGLHMAGVLYTINIINTPGADLKVAYRDDGLYNQLVNGTGPSSSAAADL